MESFAARWRAPARSVAWTASYVVTLAADDALPPCPGCGGEASSALRCSRPAPARLPPRLRPRGRRRDLAGEARRPDRRARPVPGLPTTASELSVAQLTREWTRIGRSLAADVRFDDPTVSRRHALDRAPARRRAGARRPQPQRRVRQRRAGRVERPARRRRARRRAPRPALPRRAGRRPARPPTRPRSAPIARRLSAAGPADRRPPRSALSSAAPMAATIAVLSQKGGTGKTTTVRTLTDVFRRVGLRDAGGRPRPAGQPVRLPRRRSRGRADDRRRAEPAARRPPTRSTTAIIPANLGAGRGRAGARRQDGPRADAASRAARGRATTTTSSSSTARPRSAC